MTAAKNPFNAEILPEEAVRHRRWVDARDGVLAGLGLPRVGPAPRCRQAGHWPPVLLAGPPGTGKTLLLAHLAQSLYAAGAAVQLVSAATAAADTAGANGAGILLVDDADALPDKALAAIGRRRYPGALAGSAALADRLALLGIPATLVELQPLDPDAVAPFLSAQLQRSGLPSNLLHPEAITALGRLSAGVPRTLQLLAGLALFLARFENAAAITADHVSRAAQIADGSEADSASVQDAVVNSALPPLSVATPPIGGWPLRAGLLAVAAIAAAAAIGFGSSDRPDHTETPAPTPSLTSAAPAIVTPAAPVKALSATAEQPPEQQQVKQQPPEEQPMAERWVSAHPIRDQPVHVTLTYPEGDAQGRQRAADLAAALRSKDYDVSLPGDARTPATPASSAPVPEVSYYFPEDRQLAATLVQELATRYPEAASAKLAEAPRGRHARPGTIGIALP